MDIRKELFQYPRTPLGRLSAYQPPTAPAQPGNLSVASIKALRDRTGFPMADCKNALVETNGDEEKAFAFLRINTPETYAAVGAIETIFPGVLFDVYVEDNGSILFFENETQRVVAAYANDTIHLYPNME